MQKLGFGFWLGLVSIIVVGGFIWAMIAMANHKTKQYRNSTARQVALMCTTDMATQFHIHPQLTIVINGQQQVIPANTGITEACMNSIHTHDATGKLHVESPILKDFR